MRCECFVYRLSKKRLNLRLGIFGHVISKHITLILVGFLLFVLGVGVQLFRQNRRIRRNERHLLSVQDSLQSTLDAIPDALFEMSLDGIYF